MRITLAITARTRARAQRRRQEAVQRFHRIGKASLPLHRDIALAAFEVAASYDPNHVPTHVMIAKIHRQKGDIAKARAALKTARMNSRSIRDYRLVAGEHFALERTAVLERVKSRFVKEETRPHHGLIVEAPSARPA